MTLFILRHLEAVTLLFGFSLVAVVAFRSGVVYGMRFRPKRRGSLGVLIELGYVADIPVVHLVAPGDAVVVAEWLDRMKEGVGLHA